MGSKFRIVVAVLFGFMSLIHGPVMAFAKADAYAGRLMAAQPSAHHHQQNDDRQAAGQHAGHQHGTMHGSGQPGQQSNSACLNGGDCFIAVTPPLLTPPMVFSSLMHRLTPAAAPRMIAAEIAPVDPPPRLQV